MPETLPLKPAGRKSGNKSDGLQVLKRVVQIGKMMDEEGMGLTEIYNWNMEPEQADEWGYSVRTISEMCARARKLGMQMLCQTHAENVRRTLRQFYALYNKAIDENDLRVAFLCVVQIARIRDVETSKSRQSKTDPVTSAAFKWRATAL